MKTPRRQTQNWQYSSHHTVLVHVIVQGSVKVLNHVSAVLGGLLHEAESECNNEGAK